MTDSAPREPWTARQERVAVALVVLGVVLRIARWVTDPAPFGDEAAVALPVMDRSFGALAGPLPLHAAAPLAWLWLQRCVFLAFGDGERALRLVPLVSGCAALVLLRPLARRLLAPRAALFALALAAVSWRLTDYSSVAKPYATDVLVAVALPLLALRCADEPTARRAAGLALAGAAALTVSMATVFVLGGVVAALVIRARRDRRGRGSAAVVVSVWAATFVALWFLTLRPLANDAYFQTFWAPRFAPFPPTSGADLAWYPVHLARACGLLFAPPVEGVLGAFALAALVAGVWRWGRRTPATAALVGVPWLLALGASAAHAYPFAHRLVLFLVPGCALLASEGLDAFLGRLSGRVAAVVASALVAVPFAQAAYTAAVPPGRQDVRGVVRVLASSVRPGDVVHVRYEARAAFEWAVRRTPGALDGVRVTHGANPRESQAGASADIVSLPREARVWIVFAFPGPEEERDEREVLAHLRVRGRESDVIECRGARARLFVLK